jgi:catechol 2,3-dioxygenase-like lactoylglutathione lyase family enzyme
VQGLRAVKQTVNFDDPGSYHFHLGDDVGSRSRSGDCSARSYLTAPKSKAS